MSSNKFHKIVFLAVAFVFATGCSVYSRPEKLEDYLHYIEYEKYDFDKLSKTANRLLDGKKKMPSAACSAVRRDSLFGRNFDWLYDNMPDFVIRTNSTQSRYASIGMAAPISILKEKRIESLWGKIVLNLLPIFTVDGINENGVACCVNVVSQGDCGYTVGTNPGKPRMYAALFVRYVLDHASSATEAVGFLDDFDIYTSTAYELRVDYHFMIADSVNTYIVEFVDNKDTVLASEHIMTNYNLSGGVTPHAIGVERYDLLHKGWEKACGEDGMLDLMESVWYSGMYNDQASPLWLSELCSENDVYGLTTDDIRTAPEKFRTALETERKRYLERSRKKEDTWHTVHTSIYNLFTKTFSVYPQESRRRYDFSLERDSQ